MIKKHVKIKLFLIVAVMGLFAGCATSPYLVEEYDILERAEQGAAKISDYDTASSLASDDTVLGRDVSDTTMASTGTTKQFTVGGIAALAELDNLADLTICAVDDIPTSPGTGEFIMVTDGDSACDTTTGDGEYVSLHRYNGTSWDCIGDGGGSGSSFDQDLNTTDDVEFNSMTSGSVVINSTDLKEWATSTAYVVDDFVFNAGAFYVCTSGHTSGTNDDEPGDSDGDWVDYWSVIGPVSTMDIGFDFSLLVSDGQFQGVYEASFDAGEDIDQFELVYYDSTATEMLLADNSTAGEWPAEYISVSTSTVSDGNAIVLMQQGWIYSASHGYTVKAPLYLSTSGALTETAPSTSGSGWQPVGMAFDANLIWIDIDPIHGYGEVP